MIDVKKKVFLEETYNLNLLDDVIFKDDKQVSFFIDVNKRPYHAHMISGKLDLIALPNHDVFTTDELLSFVDEDNLLAEVEGKYNFIESIRKKFNTFKTELYLFIPIKRDTTPLWLYVSLKRVTINHNHLVYGHVVRVYENTPVEIIHYQKTYQDPLTKLFTRETLKMHIENLSSASRAYVMYLDIDRFKRINDKFGHQAGDQFLIDIANHFISKWEYNVLYYRLGGDEFFVYCYDHDRHQVESRAQQLISEIEQLNDISKAVNVSVSVGIVEITHENKGYHNLLNLGDQTMYISKSRGPGNYTFYQK
jgi:diguanylate cyclase (GGDEF)-like protein